MSEHDDSTEAPESPPQSPKLGRLRKKPPTKLHAFGDIHGWAPGLITYLISHKLASISIDDKDLGSDGSVDEGAMAELFGRPKDGSEPSAGLRGFPRTPSPVNGEGHGSIQARWIADDDTAFVQIGDVFDRADHSEVACEILRQLIIDAPNRVFVLVGNHEQFMLEDDVSNWVMNDRRNAIQSHEDLIDSNSSKHTRHLPNLDLQDTHERACLAIFGCYRLCVFTLYLTQGAAQQKSGFINRRMDKDLVDGLLSPDWSPYLVTKSYLDDVRDVGVEVPGALVAMVIGENLFHHAEPGEHLNELPSRINWKRNRDWGWLDYTRSEEGITKPTHLLWHRNASDGAFSGSPRVANQMDGIRKEWPGLFRIIHGHSPTVGVAEFTRAMGKNKSSTSCSYLAENISIEPRRGMASGIRIYNIDEGMSPHYYEGSNTDSTTRVPVGLREASEENMGSHVCVHTDSDEFISLESSRTVEKDTRELWAWGPEQSRFNPKEEWILNVNSGMLEKAMEFDDYIWIVRISQAGHEVARGHISGYSLIPNLIRTILRESGVKWKLPENPPKALEYITSPLLGKVFAPLISGADDAGTKVAKKLSFQAIGLSCQDTAEQKLVSINMSDIDEPHEDSELNLRVTLNYGLRGKKKLDYAGHSVTVEEIYCKSPFSICSDPKVGRYWLDYWLGDDSENEFVGASCIAFNPLSTKGGNSKPKLKEVSHWKTPKIEPPKVRNDEPKIVPTSKEQSGSGKTGIASWFRGPKKKEGILAQQERLHSSPESKRPVSRKTAQSVQEQQKRLDKEHKKSTETAPSPPPIQQSAEATSDPQPNSSQKNALSPSEEKSLIGINSSSSGLKIILDNNEVNELLSRCDIAKRKNTQPPMRIKIVKISKGAVTTLDLLDQKNAFNWVIRSVGGGIPACKKNKHGIDGRDLKKLIEHQSFADFLQEHEKGVGW